MDWTRVSTSELLEALQEVDWGHPRTPGEFFTRFTGPKDPKKWLARLKANVYYFRANYLIIGVLAYLACFLRNPLALLAVAIVTVAVLCLNDACAASLNDRLLRLIQGVHRPTALRIRAKTVHGGTGPLSSQPRQRRSKHRVYILMLPRTTFVLLCLLAAGLLMRASAAWLTLAWGTLLALGLPLLHASFRSPNLKVKLVNAQNEFRAAWSAWREHQAGALGLDHGGANGSAFGVYGTLGVPDYTR